MSSDMLLKCYKQKLYKICGWTIQIKFYQGKCYEYYCSHNSHLSVAVVIRKCHMTHTVMYSSLQQFSFPFPCRSPKPALLCWREPARRFKGWDSLQLFQLQWRLQNYEHGNKLTTRYKHEPVFPSALFSVRVCVCVFVYWCVCMCVCVCVCVCVFCIAIRHL